MTDERHNAAIMALAAITTLQARTLGWLGDKEPRQDRARLALIGMKREREELDRAIADMEAMTERIRKAG